MKLFFFLGHTFFKQSMEICRLIKQHNPSAEFAAIVAARSDLMDILAHSTDPRFSRYDWLSSMEATWLATPLDRNKLNDYRERLGDQELNRIIIADRELGVGFVSGGKVERTALIDKTLHNDEARWSYVVGLLDYYFEAFEKEKPDLAFAYCVAGAVAYAMGVVAKHLDIPFIQPVGARVKHYHILDDNIHWLLRPVERLFKETLKNPALVHGKKQEAEEFIAQFRSKPVSPQETVRWIQEIKKNNTLIGLCKTLAVDIARWGAIRLGLKGTKDVLRQRSGVAILKNNLAAFYYLRKTVGYKVKYFAKEIGNDEYLYFPLHVDPEASTMVLADLFTDQLYIIESIAKSMPAGMKLVVKEHIPCLGRRPKGFYERIYNMPNVVLVHPFVNNFELIKNSRLVCTITGTAGWESMLLGKPPLIFGNVHYLSVGEGFVHCQDMTKLGIYIAQALTLEPIAYERLVLYIASIMTLGITISPDDIWFEKYADLDKRQETTQLFAQQCILLIQQHKAESRTEYV